MKLIKQKFRDDCAIAALAMAASISYSKAYKLVRPYGNYTWLTGTYDEEICAAMRRLDIDYELTYDKRFVKLCRPAVVCIDLADDKSHAVAYDPKTKSIFDPGWYMVGYSLGYCLKKFGCAIINHGKL